MRSPGWVLLCGAIVAGCSSDGPAADTRVAGEWRPGDGPALDGPVAAADGAGDGASKPEGTAKPDAARDSGTVGNPGLFTRSVLELDFSQGANGRYRASGGAWQDFNPWNKPGVNGNWSNAGVNVQTTNEVRTELVPNALGPGKVLRTWIEAGDQWKSTATYPRTELTSSYTAGIPWKSEWRLELPFYASGDVKSTGSSIIAFQLHHNGNTGSPPFGLYLDNGTMRFSIEENPGGPSYPFPVLPLQANTRYDLVVELKFGYVSDGAYVKLWANGKQYVNLTNRNVGYPNLESTAGYWKFCSLYDWGNKVNGSRSVFSGPVLKMLRR